MIATLWRKHWMELRGKWALSIAIAAVPAIIFARVAELQRGPAAPLVEGFNFLFIGFVLGVLPARFTGTGLTTDPGIRLHRGADPSLAFTLSLPVRRRTLFFYRTGFCLLAIETAVMLGLVMGAAAFARLGDSTQVFTDGLRVLLLLVPLYFLDSLLSLRFDAVSVMQVQILGAVGLWFVLLPLAGVKQQMMVTTLSRIAPVPFALLTLLIAAGLAAVTVWRLDRHDY
jgi:hypothetical protein